MKDTKMMQSIKTYVNAVYGFDITKNTRKREFVEARALYFKLCKELTKESLTRIGESVGRDHSGVIHSLNNVLHHLNAEDVEKALLHFDCVENLPLDSYAYIVFENTNLKNKLHKKTEVLKLLPQLEIIYNSLNKFTEEQKELLSKRNDLQFKTIERCLNRVEEIIETEKV
tara:strand:- start:53 stop:565 length:513 start_codon:yes stop_codon:yes gene_type:complete